MNPYSVKVQRADGYVVIGADGKEVGYFRVRNRMAGMIEMVGDGDLGTIVIDGPNLFTEMFAGLLVPEVFVAQVIKASPSLHERLSPEFMKKPEPPPSVVRAESAASGK